MANVAGRGAPAMSFELPVVHARRVSAAVRGLLCSGVATGDVLAVHRTALTLRVGERLVTIAGESAGGLPDGVNVAGSFSPRHLGLAAGMPVRCEWGGIRIGARLRLDLAGAATWSAELTRVDVPLRALGVRVAVFERAAARARGVRTAPMFDDGLEIRTGGLHAAL